MTKIAGNINEVIEKLQDAVSKERLNGYFGTPNSAEKIGLFEKSFGVRLPNSFKTFLRNFDGGFIADGEADSMIMTGEFDEAKQISTRILSIDEIIEEYESLSLDDWKLESGYEGFYPYIPFCITPEDEKLVFVDNSLRKEESNVLAAFHDAPASGWFVVSANFTDFLENYFNTGGHPDLYGNPSETHAEEWLDLLNGRQKEKENPEEIIGRSTVYLSLFPNDAVTYITRGDAFFQLKQYEKALADYNKSIELDQKNALAYYCRGDMLLSLKKARQALTDLDSACQLKPDDPFYLTGRADAFYALNRLDKALVDCNRAIEIDERYFSAYSTRRKIYSNLGEAEKSAADAKMIDELLAEDE